MITRSRLANGLRVVHEQRPGAPRAAVAVHYGVGYRDEEPGREGFAHLFEHLMFRGSASLPPGAFFDVVVGAGGRAGGTTHPDYTDYHQVVPARALERALFCEADRMRAPVFTEQTVAEQVAGVLSEIRQNTRDRPFGGLTWPMLPGVLHRGYANAHDGYGGEDSLAAATPADCAAFFARHYPPANAVLTVVAPDPAERVLALVHRHFDDVEARPAPVRPDLTEPASVGGQRAHGTEPGVDRAAVAAGWVLPDPTVDLDAYLDHLVLARLLAGADRDAGCGWFGPLDARAPDAFVVSGVTTPGPGVGAWLEALDARCAELAAGPPPGQLARAVAGTVTDRLRDDAGLTARARARGRFELLFGRAELLDELPGRLSAVTARGVAAAAGRIATAAAGVLVLEPGATRTRPAAPTWPAAPSPDAAPSDRSPSARSQPDCHPSDCSPPERRSGRRAVPAPGPRTRPTPPPWAERVLPGGRRLVAVRDARAPLVELRARLPLGPAGWVRPERVPALVWLVAEACSAQERVEAVGARLSVDTDGQWLEVTGVAPPAAAGRWIAAFTDLTTGAGVDPADPRVAAMLARAGSAERSRTGPERVTDDTLRRIWLGPVRPGDPRDALGVAGGGCVLAVGDLDPQAWVEEFGDPVGRGGADRVAGTAAPRPAPTPIAVPATVLAPIADTAAVVATVSAPEHPDPGAEAARYLCTAALGGGRASRLRGLEDLQGMAGYGAHAGRDTLGPSARGFVRLAAPTDRIDAALGHVWSVLEAFAADPPRGPELREVARYCADELLTMFDSPGGLANGMVRVLAADPAADPDTVTTFGSRLVGLDDAQVAAVAAERAGRLTTALMTDVIDLRGRMSSTSSNDVTKRVHEADDDDSAVTVEEWTSR